MSHHATAAAASFVGADSLCECMYGIKTVDKNDRKEWEVCTLNNRKCAAGKTGTPCTSVARTR